jgi:hypothetical protein
MRHRSVQSSFAVEMRLSRLLKYGLSACAVGALIGGWLYVDHPPYPSVFKIEWDEEVQVTDHETIWAHRDATYWRSSAWSKWGARKIAESLKFAPTPQIGTVSYSLELGAFGGIERIGADWVIAFAGTKLDALRIGSCTMRGRGPCVVVIRSDGSVYKPVNTREILNNFYPLLRCRTSTQDCYERFNNRRITLTEKLDYARANPDGTTPSERTGKPFEPADLQIP